MYRGVSVSSYRHHSCTIVIFVWFGNDKIFATKYRKSASEACNDALKRYCNMPSSLRSTIRFDSDGWKYWVEKLRRTLCGQYSRHSHIQYVQLSTHLQDFYVIDHFHSIHVPSSDLVWVLNAPFYHLRSNLLRDTHTPTIRTPYSCIIQFLSNERGQATKYLTKYFTLSPFNSVGDIITRNIVKVQACRKYYNDKDSSELCCCQVPFLMKPKFKGFEKQTRGMKSLYFHSESPFLSHKTKDDCITSTSPFLLTEDTKYALEKKKSAQRYI